MIEIGEAMDVVITNLLLAKKDIDEVSRITQYPIDYVRNISISCRLIQLFL